MRITALLLSLLLIIAPFSGAMAMAGGNQGAGTDAAHHDHMPCHGEAAPAATPCDNCAQADCNLLDCEHCANAVFGIPAGMPLAAQPSPRVQHRIVPQVRHSPDLVPDSPPPIA